MHTEVVRVLLELELELERPPSAGAQNAMDGLARRSSEQLLRTNMGWAAH